MKITLIAKDQPKLSARDLSNFVFYLDSIYKRLVIFSEKENQYFLKADNFYRQRLPEEKELIIWKIHKESPLLIGFLTGVGIGIGVSKAFLELLKVIRDWNLDKEYKELTNEQIERDILKKEIDILKEIMTDTELKNLVLNDIKKLARSPIKVEEIEQE